MKLLLLDTCIILHILRADDRGKKSIDIIETMGDDVIIVVSVVTKAELESLKIQNGWGQARTQKLDAFLENAIYVDIVSSDNKLLQSYTSIDSYSRRKMPDSIGNLLPKGAIQMGKNDLWIAATAHSLNIPLLTADNDFDHLNSTFLKVVKVS